MFKLNKNTSRIIVIVLLGIMAIGWLYSLNESYEAYYDLVEEYNGLVNRTNEFRGEVLCRAEDNQAVVTIMYYTNFSRNQQIITLSVPYEQYNASHYEKHPYWCNETLTYAIDYITYNETIINQIVETIKNQTQSKEELANALLDFVQDKGHGLSIRYYPTNELKYPLETLVEMGGDCDTHAFLYGTLMKAAGFKVLLLLSKEKIEGQLHVAAAIHLENSPKNSLSKIEDKDFTYNGEKYYYAETTNRNWRVGDLPPELKNLTFYLTPI